MSWRNLFGLFKSFLHPPTSIIFSGATLLHAFPPCINKCRAGLSEETYNAEEGGKEGMHILVPPICNDKLGKRHLLSAELKGMGAPIVDDQLFLRQA